MSELTTILRKYYAGEASLEATNAALKEIDANLYLDPNRNVIKPEEMDRFGLLDTGTGSLDKCTVDPEKMELVYEEFGPNMKAFVKYMGKLYRVEGKKLVLYEG